ncbi:lanthionine synthetase C family protein [Crossiella sp. SN42]|uniref:lanthionine synthetase C family protein n=1 Tax=Crossiella sp. SN42 TaxID=2944808 RepID=UPI00207D67D5|nr:lanthionine synthetase C family protein [Crossiella sp. SN42]MCO1575630.1 lanthionine synthetase C family protein [Crossiella sp. SN42]
MADSKTVIDRVMQFTEQSTHPMEWYFPSFGYGHAGIAVLHVLAAAAAPDEEERTRSMETGFTFIREAVAGTRAQPLQAPGMFSGTSGLALCVAACAEAEPRFWPSVHRLHDQLAAQAIGMSLPRVERQVSDSDYDMITGAAGILAYLCSITAPGDALRAAIDHVLDYLVWLSEPPRDLTLTRRWLIDPQFCVQPGRDPDDFPGGYLNLGMAHGIPGVLAALAAAWRAGHRRPGHEQALRRIVDWLLQVRRDDAHGPVWATDIPVAATGEEVRPDNPQDQVAWCYGTAGVALSLLVASEALDDPGLHAVACESFAAVLRRTTVSASHSSTFCHGLAGVLAICLEFAAAGSATAREHAPRLLSELLSEADPELPLVFRDQEEPGTFVDSPALLTGSTGVALTLLASVSPVRPAWLRAFLVR